jgi:hypothetical protein
MQMVTEASQDQLVRIAKFGSQEARALINGADMLIMRVLSELARPDLEFYDPGPVADDEGTATMILAPEPPLGMLDIEVSGTIQDPVVRINLLPVADVPLTAKMEERWTPGEPGGRSRRVCWTFEWDSGLTRQITYDIGHNGDGADYAADARRRAALMLAELAGWPLPLP